MHKWCPTFLGVFEPPLPPNPILSYFSSCPYFMMSYFDPHTPSPPLSIQKLNTFYRKFPKLAKSFKYLAEKLYIYICKKLICTWLKNCMGKTMYTFISEKIFYFIFFFFWKKTQQNMGCPIFAKVPTPLVRFCPILLDPPNPP